MGGRTLQVVGRGEGGREEEGRREEEGGREGGREGSKWGKERGVIEGWATVAHITLQSSNVSSCLKVLRL